MNINKLASNKTDRITRPKISFGFSEVRDVSYIDAKRDASFFLDFIRHLRQFCLLTWDDIRSTQRHGFGSETIEVDRLSQKAMRWVPAGLKKLLVLRATGDNHAFLGYRDGNIFQILFIEYCFGDVYRHGR